MWKHALLCNNNAALPECEAHEQHIIKTAQRLEELNSWVSQDLRTVELFSSYTLVCAWLCLVMNEGISVNFTHSTKDTAEVYDILCNHILAHETLEPTRQVYLLQALLIRPLTSGYISLANPQDG